MNRPQNPFRAARRSEDVSWPICASIPKSCAPFQSSLSSKGFRFKSLVLIRVYFLISPSLYAPVTSVKSVPEFEIEPDELETMKAFIAHSVITILALSWVGTPIIRAEINEWRRLGWPEGGAVQNLVFGPKTSNMLYERGAAY